LAARRRARAHGFGRLDILVNNAGISGFIGPLVDYPVESFDQVMASTPAASSWV
jgi:NAD(P)-dependent dehydrogenase (short-subunit alcohol dehydrogenase family)